MASTLRHVGYANPATVFPQLERRSIAVNTANRQLAVGDEAAVGAGTPLPLLAIRYFDARAQYATNDMISHQGTIWKAKAAIPPGAFNPSQWTGIAGGSATGEAAYVLIDGSRAMLGPLTLMPGAPASDEHAANKAYVDASVTLANTNANDRVLRSGDTMSGDLTVSKASPRIALQSLDSSTGTQIASYASTPTFRARWAVGLGIGDANGDDFAIARYNSVGGAFQDFPLRIDRATGRATVNGDPTEDLGIATKQTVDAARAVADAASTTANNCVLKSGDTMSGDLGLSKSNPSIFLNKTQPGDARISGAYNGLGRWTISLGSLDAETGGNVGTNFGIHRYSDLGAYLGMTLAIERSSGRVTLNYGVHFHSSADSNFYAVCIGNYNTISLTSKCNLAVDRTTGNITLVRDDAFVWSAIGGDFNVHQPLKIQGDIAQINCAPAHQGCFSVYQQGTGGVGFWNANGPMYFGQVNALGIPHAVHMQIASTGIQLFVGQAYKPGGGSWADSSDGRIKTIVGDYESGLAEIVALHPVRFTFKGNDTRDEPAGEAPYTNSPHYEAATSGTEFIGMIAQEVEQVLPELVSLRSAMIDGVEVTDLRDMDTTPLVYALINAVKELDARLQELEP